jgi:aspartyl-tRNA(Asn)/glutamyl-tRNA(Gln) amidotransferase subunit A
MPVLTPTIVATDIGGGPAMAKTFGEITRYLRWVNFLGVPSLALPCGFDSRGLPLGMQLVGGPFSEATLLRLGHAYQGATSWHRRIPACDAVTPSP